MLINFCRVVLEMYGKNVCLLFFDIIMHHDKKIY